MNDYFFISAPQLRRTPLGAHAEVFLRPNHLPLTVMAVLVFVGCKKPQPSTAFDADTAAIRQLYRDWPRTVEAADADRYVTFIDDSITLLVPGAPAVHGVPTYRELVKRLLQGPRYRVLLKPANQLQVARPWAFAQYEAQVTTLSKVGGDSSTAHNRYVDVLRRQPNGAWRVYIHSWQNDAPAKP